MVDFMPSQQGREEPGGIFLSYRREETAQVAGRLADRLRERFGAERIFIDVESIGLGLDFTEELTKALNSCDLLLALIGKQWLTVLGEEGRRRLDDENDYVRIEIETALQRNIRVIPILVDGAAMPRTEQLPASLHALVRRQTRRLSHEDFVTQASHLIDQIAPLLPWAPQTSQPVSTPISEKGSPRVEVLGRDKGELSLCIFLKEMHRLDINTHMNRVSIKLDGKRQKERFSILDGNQEVQVSCMVHTRLTFLHCLLAKVVLIVDGAVVFQEDNFP